MIKWFLVFVIKSEGLHMVSRGSWLFVEVGAALAGITAFSETRKLP